MTEMLDVVDKKGRFLKAMPRAEVHAKGLLHRGVRVLIFNRAGEMFIQQRALSKDVNPGLWEGSLAGHQDFGEKPLQTAMRETKEELGLNVSPKRFRTLGNFRTNNARERMFYTLFVVHNVKKTPTLDAQEVLQGHWETPVAVSRHLREHPEKYTPGFRLAWQIFSKKR
jgi:isopentenyl-diphosphate delta-isomerase